MTSLVTTLSASVISALVSAIWQGALLALCVALILKLLPGISAAVRSTLWLIAFALAVALHFVPASLGVPSGSASASRALHAAPAWSFALALAWLLLSLFRATQFTVGALRLRAIACRATPVSSTPQAPAPGRRYTLCTSSDIDRPSVLGFWQPRILLPPGLLETLTPAELDQVLLHETEHLSRADDWTNLLQKLALVLFPLNPVLFWVERRLCLERELACDDRVLASTGSRKSYATCLARIAEHGILRRHLSLALGAWSRESELSRRVLRILNRPQPLLSRPRMRLASAAVAVGLAAATIVLARMPRLITFNTPPDASAFASQPAAQLPDLGAWPASSAVAVRTAAASPVAAQAVPLVVRTAASVSASPLRATRVPLRHRVTPRKHTARAFAADLRGDATTLPDSPPAVLAITYRGPTVQPLYVPALLRVPAYAAVRTPDGWIILEL